MAGSSAEGIELQEQKSLHTVLSVLFCHVASAFGVLPVPCPDQRRCLSHPSLPAASSAPRSSRCKKAPTVLCACAAAVRVSLGWFGVCLCFFLTSQDLYCK